MSRFRYRAVTADGQRVRGEMDAADLGELEQRLRARELTFINGEAARSYRWRGRALPRRELMQFCFQLEQLLQAGIPPFESLAALRDASTHAKMRTVIAELLADIERGQTFSAAAARQGTVFAPVFVALLRAGEESGRLPEAVRDIAAALQHDDELATHARRIAIYPAIVAAVLLAVVVVGLVHVVPELEKLFHSSGRELPLQTRILIGASRLFSAWWWALLLVVVLALGGLQLGLRRSAALQLRWHAAQLRLPITGELRRKLALARFAGLLSTLYRAGITVIDALRVAEDALGNLALREGVRTATRQIEAGRMISAAFESVALFPPLLVRMLKIGEHSGGLDRALDNIASAYRRDVADAIGRLQAALEPVLTVVMGGALLWIAAAILGPIYELITQLPG